MPDEVFPIPGKRPIHEETVREIRRLFWQGESSLKELCTTFSLSHRTVFLLVHHLTYWWVENERPSPDSPDRMEAAVLASVHSGQSPDLRVTEVAQVGRHHS